MKVEYEMISETEALLASEDLDGFHELQVSCSICGWDLTVDNYTDLVYHTYTHTHDDLINCYSYDITIVPEYSVDVTLTVGEG